VDGAGHQFFTGAALAGDQNCAVSGGYRADEFVDLQHRRADSNHLRLFAEFFLQLKNLVPHLAALQRVGGKSFELFHIERLGDVVEGAEFECLDRAFRACVRRDEDELSVGSLQARALQNVDARHGRHFQVADNQVIEARSNAIHSPPGLFFRVHVITGARKADLQNRPHTRLVVQYQNFRHFDNSRQIELTIYVIQSPKISDF